MHTLLVTALVNALLASILALLVALASRFLRHPALVHALWLLVLVKLITPPLVPISWAMPMSQETSPAPLNLDRPLDKAGSADEEPTALGDESLAESSSSLLGESGWPGADSIAFGPLPQGQSRDDERSSHSEPNSPPAASPLPRLNWQAIIAAVWFSGSAAWITLAIWRILRFRRLIVQAGPADEALQAEAANLAHRLGLRQSPRVLLVRARVPPLLWGLFWRPVIVLPAELMQRLSAERRATLIAHELAHVRRGDRWVRCLEMVVLCIHWWHPVAWWACRALRNAEEICCDGWVVTALPGSAKVYAQSLLETVEFLSSARLSLPGLASGFGQVQLFQRRLQMILSRHARYRMSWTLRGLVVLLAALVLPESVRLTTAEGPKNEPIASGSTSDVDSGTPGVASSADWNQWGGSPMRNNAPDAKNIPTQWSAGQIDPDTEQWKPRAGKNIKWIARLGSRSYTSAVVAGGKVFVGTNNDNGYLKRYPSVVDLGVLLCFNEADGKFLWQDSSEKLPGGRVHDWPNEGCCSTPLVEGNRLWYVTNRCEVKCLDTDGFFDGVNNGPFKDEASTDKDEADIIWRLDMINELGVSPRHMSNCSVTAAGDILLVCTSNGVDGAHVNNPAPSAPSFLALDKNTGKVLWSDNSPGANVLDGQWSSPAYAVLGGVPQAIFAGGDGWLYSFLATAESENGKPKLLWKFDCNPKQSKYLLGGRGDRNPIVATPVIHDGLVYIGVGRDPEQGEGVGHLWCIDPTKRGDVSDELAFNGKDVKHVIAPKRTQAVDKEQGEVAQSNPNSAVMWHYAGFHQNKDKPRFEESMHRTLSSVAIKDGLLFVTDFSGLLHCLDAKTGKAHWTHDLLSECWGSPLIVEGKVYVGSGDGDIYIFKLSPKKELLSRDKQGQPGGINMGGPVFSTPIVANGVLYISNKTHLFAIQEDQPGEKTPKPKPQADARATPQQVSQDQASDKDIAQARQEMLEAAKEAYENHVAEEMAGRSTIDSLYTWSRRWMDAQMLEKDKNARLKAAQEHLKRMEEVYTNTKARVDQGSATRASLAATKFWVAEAKQLIKLVEKATPNLAEKAQADAKAAAQKATRANEAMKKFAQSRQEMIDAAKETYKINLALAAAGRSTADPVYTYTWSRRLMDAQMLGQDKNERLKAAQEHLKRMEELYTDTKARHDMGSATSADLEATKFWVAEGKNLISLIEKALAGETEISVDQPPAQGPEVKRGESKEGTSSR